MPQPTLDHASPEFRAAKSAEDALLAAYRLTARDQWLEFEALRVRVTTIGEGPPVLVSPGNTGDGFPFIPLIARLPGFTFHVLNRPGGGLSDGLDHAQIVPAEFVAALYARVFDALGLASAPVLAHSMGCHWATLFALAHPHRVRRAVFIGNPGNLLPGRPPLPLRAMLLPGIGEFVFRRLLSTSEADGMKAQKMMGSDMAAIAKLPRELSAAYFRFQRLPNYVSSTVTLLRRFASNAPGAGIPAAQLAQLNLPTLLVWGDNDTFGDLEKAKRITAAIPGARLEVISGAGHMPWLDRAEDVARVTAEFLEH